MRIVDTETDSLADTCARILTCTELAALDRQVLQPVAERIAATSSVYFRFAATPRGDCHASSFAYAGGTPEAAEAYLDHFYTLDPVIRSGLDWLHDPSARVATVSGLSLETVDVRHRPYRDAFLHRYDVGQVLALMVPCPVASGAQLSCLGFHRSVGGEPFSTEDIRELGRLAPAMTSVLRLLAFQDAERLTYDVLGALGSAWGGLGFVILDQDLAIENANARGLADLEVTGEARVSPLLGEVRQHLLQSNAVDGAPQRRVLNTRGRSGAPIEISLSRLAAPGGQERHLLITSEPLSGRALSQALKAYQLTEREAEIARLVAVGMANADLAFELGISPRTVENHVRSIYEKVGVSSRTQLISTLLRLQ